ncbi:MAG: hypothetical protein AB7V18_14265 [Pyrinomonadaceae bacterium]
MRDDRERLLDILEAIERIEKYTARGRSVFDENELIETWSCTTFRSSAKPFGHYRTKPPQKPTRSNGLRSSG